MKQTKKLTRNQRSFLSSKGIKDTENLRFCKETKTEFVYYDVSKGEVVTIVK